jgi:heme/copper-type cytochrome/quinol oxidase subunit 2
MRGSVVVEEESAHQAWLEEQLTFAEWLAQAQNGARDVADLVSSEGKSGSGQKRVGAMRQGPMTQTENEATRRF